MGLLNDVIQFVTVAILGMKDSSKVYAENVESAERYLRWGQEKSDARDFLSALQHAEKASDENAPKQELLVRKYTVLFEAIASLIRLSILKYQHAAEKVSGQKKSAVEEVEAAKTSLDTAKALVKKLEDDGTMIKAQEEARHVEELERHLTRLQENAGTEDFDSGLSGEYRSAQEEVHRYKNKFGTIGVKFTKVLMYTS